MFNDRSEIRLHRSILRDPPTHAVRDGRMDPGLPVCICGEQVAVAHKECIALFAADESGKNEGADDE